MLKTFSLASFALCLIAAVSLSAPTSAGTVKAKAQISNDAGFNARVQYLEKTKQQTTQQKLTVKVTRAMPLQTLEVAINGQVVGTITTNPGGRGKLTLKSPSAVIPPVQSGDVITIGTSSGTFFTKADKYHVQGHLSLDGTSIAGLVKYHQKPRQGQLDRRFWVNLEGAGVGEVFDVYVNGAFIGSITADDLGEGTFKLRAATFANGAWQAMPDDFPALVAGDVVSVGAMTVTLN